MTEKRPRVEYVPTGWQNFNRRLTREELDDITRRISGIHFAKEAFADDPITTQLLYAAEALLREVLRLAKDNPFPEGE